MGREIRCCEFGHIGRAYLMQSSPFQGLGATSSTLNPTWEFPKITDTFSGVLIIGIIVFWGLYWGSLILGNY